MVNENKSSSSRQALFLVIYVPNRESLEVWSMQNYEKILVHKVSKHGRYVLFSNEVCLKCI